MSESNSQSILLHRIGGDFVHEGEEKDAERNDHNGVPETEQELLLVIERMV